MKDEFYLKILTARLFACSPVRLIRAFTVHCLLPTAYWYFPAFCLLLSAFLFLASCISPEEKILNQDRRLQQAAQAALGERQGSVVIMDPQSGRLRAVVNPQWVFRKAFPPGSTFKMATALAALESGKIDPERVINCKGKAVIGGVSVRCHDPRGHGAVNLEAALGYSCNIYFYTAGYELGKEPILHWARELGLGESALPMAGAAEPQTTRELLDLAVGEWEGLEVTPLELLRAYTAVAGKGELLTAYQAETLEKLKRVKPPPAKSLNLGSSQEPIRRGLRRSVFEGTARLSGGKTYDLLAKTGTAAIREGWGAHAWFVGLAPAQQPKIAFVVFLWRGTGYKDAAAVAQKILEAWEKEQK